MARERERERESERGSACELREPSAVHIASYSSI